MALASTMMTPFQNKQDSCPTWSGVYLKIIGFTYYLYGMQMDLHRKCHRLLSHSSLMDQFSERPQAANSSSGQQQLQMFPAHQMPGVPLLEWRECTSSERTSVRGLARACCCHTSAISTKGTSKGVAFPVGINGLQTQGSMRGVI